MLDLPTERDADQPEVGIIPAIFQQPIAGQFYQIRHPQLADLPALLRLEAACWPEPLRASTTELQQRLELFPNGHWVLEGNGQVVGVIYSQRIADVEQLAHLTNLTVASLHDPRGTVIQLLAVSVLPTMQHLGLGDQLLEFMLQTCAHINEIDTVVAVTLCKHYVYEQSQSLADYIQQRDEHGQLLDPLLRFHESHGATIRRILPGYRPYDTDNQGQGILVEYDIHNRQRPALNKQLAAPLQEKPVGQALDAAIAAAVRRVQRSRRGAAFDWQTPFMEMGLDSLDLLALRASLGQSLGAEIDPTFFFRYPSPKAIAEYFRQRQVDSHDVQAPPTQPPTSPEADSPAPLLQAAFANHVAVGGPNESIAIVGMACRFPGGVQNSDDYWALLRNGVDAITEVPAARWGVDQEVGALPRFGGFLEQVDQFDAGFFRIAPVEANALDPQQRLLLETSWEALEQAAINPSTLAGTEAGIFVGMFTHDYELLQVKQQTPPTAYFGTGNAVSVAAGRLAYFFGCQGPTLAVDTACSSSLVAVHLACQSLRQGECQLALAAGVNLLLAPEMSLTFANAGMLAPDGRCKTFDAAADGYVRSEGCAVVVLKRLADALAAGDPICAIIRGTAINQDGASNGLTAPNGLAQEKVLRRALTAAGVAPAAVSYIEAHGTGTMLGDPIEIKALAAVYGEGRTADNPLIVGSVKTNIGHTEAAAGLAGLIKVVLALQHQYIPPHLHFQTLNPYLTPTQVVIPVQGRAWPRAIPAKPRLAGVSSFGFSGTNAHLILEEAPLMRAEDAAQREQKTTLSTSPHDAMAWGDGSTHTLLTLSAQNEQALVALAQRYVNFLAAKPAATLPEIGYTTHTGRAHFDHRLAIVTDSVERLHQQLSQVVAPRGHPKGEIAKEGRGIFQGQQAQLSPIAFLFTGQGSHYVEMGRTLYETQPTFRQTLDHCAEFLRPSLEESLLDVLYPKAPETGDNQSKIQNPKSKIDETVYTQPALFALEYALAMLWQSWGIRPDFVLGHSMGELVAACVAGVFSLEDALKLVAARGRLMQALPQTGAMAVIMANEQRVQAAVAPYQAAVAIAAINGPENVVISGQQADVQTIVTKLTGERIRSHWLTVSHAFHSPWLEPMLADFAQVAQSITYAPPKLALVSNLTGTLVTQEVTDPAYWVRHVREPVRFADGIQLLYQQGVACFLEIGPKPTLLGMTRSIYDFGFAIFDADLSDPQSKIQNPKSKISPPLLLPSLREGRNDWQQLLESLAALYVHGATVEWAAARRWARNDLARPRKIALPTYPFQRQRYWLDALPASSTPRLETKALKQVTDWFERSGDFTPDEIALLPKVRKGLVQQQQTQPARRRVEERLYEIVWQVQPRPNTAVFAAAPGCWLILADQGGVGAALAQRFAEQAQQTRLVYAGDHSHFTDGERWTIDPTDPTAWPDLIQAWQVTAQEAGPWRGIVHLWSLDAPATELLSTTELEKALPLGCGSVLGLLQVLVQKERDVAVHGKPRPRLWLITRGAQAIAADPAPTRLAVAQTPLWGMGRALALEQPELWGGLLDLAPTPQPTQDALQILAELLSEPDEEQVALRGGNRYVARLVRAQPESTTSTGARKLHAAATYLITGGCGVLGLAIARWLAEQGARHLVLTGRRGVTTAPQRQALADLAQSGVEVQIAQVDVTDQRGMAELFAQLKTTSAPLKGIIHAAGVLDYQSIAELTAESLAAVLHPKVSGGWLLHQLSSNLPLDFFVCYSSAAGVWGAQQQAHYAAANHFLDSLAAYRQQQGLPALSVSWGPWSGGGMMTPHPEGTRLAQLQQIGIEPLSQTQGLEALAYLLPTRAWHRVVANVDWGQFCKFYVFSRPRRLLAQLQDHTPKPSLGASVSPTRNDVSVATQSPQATASRTELVNYLKHEIAAILQLKDADTLDTRRGFAHLGMDSLMALALQKRLETHLGVALPATVAFEHPTVEKLATFLFTNILQPDPAAEREAVSGSASPTGADCLPGTTAIAIIGLGCRFPGADDPAAFWQLLCAGVDMVCEGPAERWRGEIYDALADGMSGQGYVRPGAFVTGVDQFEPQFFGIAPREAVSLDPQQRLLLEVSWEALEHAGVAAQQLTGSRTGVFVGIGQNDYAQLVQAADAARPEGGAPGARFNPYNMTGNGFSFAAGRLSYVLGLQGPNLAVDTACSSSLVAVHLACQSLRNGECELALAGGVQLMLTPQMTVTLTQMQALAADGRCKTFDAAADGYGRGEGCGVVVLKRLPDAVAAGDNILAVIRGSAVNHDGPSSGLTVPNKLAQEALLSQALVDAQIEPALVSYVDAHGTGTPLGDPIEMRALGAVFGAERARPLLVGSVKTNIGHLEAASGIAGLIKVVLSLQAGAIPANLHFHQPSPYIDWATLPVQVPTAASTWPAGRRLAGVSSFGLSGTNAHVVVEAAPTPSLSLSQHKNERSRSGRTAPSGQMLTLSAKSESALRDLARRYARLLAEQPSMTLADLCYTANTGRSHFAHRLSVTTSSLDQLQRQLTAFANGQDSETVRQGYVPAHQPAPKVAFLFTGQGAQYVEMGRALYETQPTFRQTLDHCAELLHPSLEESLLDVLYLDREIGRQGGKEARDSQSKIQNLKSKIDETVYTQPALFALEYALAMLWQSWGVRPDFVLGHSVGEVVAACVAGVFSLEDAVKLIAARGRLMQALPQVGAMAAVFADEQRVQIAIAPYQADVSLAAVNSPENVVISGRREAIQAITERLNDQGIKSYPLNVSHAFHSPLMDPMLADFAQVAQSITYTPPKLALISNLTGKCATAEVTDPAYWVRHVREPVRFADSIATLAEQGVSVFLEIGPKPTLLGMTQSIYNLGFGLSTAELSDPQSKIPNPKSQIPNPLLLPSLRSGRDDWQPLLESLGALYGQGVAIDWVGFDRDYQRRKVILPTYPFQRQRYWVDMPPKMNRRAAPVPAQGAPRTPHSLPLIDRMMKLPHQQQTIFEKAFSIEALPFLADHCLYGKVAVPGACHLALVLSGLQLSAHQLPHQLEDVIFPQILTLAASDGALGRQPPTGAEIHTVQLCFQAQADQLSFQVISFGEDAPNTTMTHATGRIRSGQRETPQPIDLNALQARCPEWIANERVYSAIDQLQIVLGPRFRWFDAVWRGTGEVIARLRLPESIASVAGYPLFPSLIDACFQLTFVTWLDQPRATLVPFALDALTLYQPTNHQELWCHVQEVGEHKWDIHLLDSHGQPVATIAGFVMRAASPAAVTRQTDEEPWRQWLYTVAWQPRPIFGLFPTYLPDVTQLHAQMQAHFNQLRIAGLDHYGEMIQALEGLALDYVLAAFAQAGVTFQTGMRWSSAQFIRQLGVLPRYQRLLERLLAMLVEAGILQQREDSWQVRQTAGLRPPQPQSRLLSEQAGTVIAAELALLERCGEKLGAVLRGVQDPLELLFPAGQLSLVAKLYEASPGAQVMNRLVQQAVLRILEHLPLGQGVRILEIGAGTGGTTAALLPHLPTDRTEYLFTDIGAGFLSKARVRFMDYGFIHYQTLDIERPPADQGFRLGQSDIIIAANVLHATRDLRQTLSHVRQLLAPGGLLVLLESTSRRRWVDLTFGLTEGWWRFADHTKGAQTDGRADHPLLPAAQWRALLGATGFHAITYTPEPNLDEHLGQTVFIAQADTTPVQQAQPWLLFADGAQGVPASGPGMGNALAGQLQQRGIPSLLVYAGDAYQQVDEQTFYLRPDQAEDYLQLFTALSAALPSVQGIVHLWSLDAPGLDSTLKVDSVARQGCESVLYLVQALLRTQATPPPLWLATPNAQAVQQGDPVIGAAQALLWGMSKTIVAEHPELHCTCIDLDMGSAQEAQAARLCAELLPTPSARPREDQVAFRGQARYVARLLPYSEPKRSGFLRPGSSPTGERSAPSFRLEIGERGALDNLQLRPQPRRAPGPGEVEIRVQATGLNFRDVLNALGLYPGDPGLLGLECAGTIVAIGAEVDQFAVGDGVVAIAPGAFSQYLTLPALLVLPKPPDLDAAAAATIPIAFVTAAYCLHHLAQIKARPEGARRVLIHTATGGVGQAAIQLAQQAGAEVFATASPAKWDALRALGVTHVYNSRTLAFAEAILADTAGRGVDIILNSLTGEGFIQKNLAALAPNGCFVELSKRAIWSAAQVAAVRPDVRYATVDLVEMVNTQPALVHTLLSEIITAFRQNKLKPLPYTEFPIQEADVAFKQMQQAKHIGKIVVTQPPTPAAITIRPDGAYLITGGLGGLGLQTARWLAEQGARCLLLVGRHQPNADALRQLDELTAQGSQVIVAQADVTDEQALATALTRLPAGCLLRGVIHAAGVLEDGVLLEQNSARFARALAPKVLGAWHLHRLTKHLPLDFFVLFSSTTGLLGNPGQANHAAANAFLDAFAHYRRAQKLPALSIDWGAWAEVGAAARMAPEQRARLQARGQGSIAPAQGLAAFAYLLNQPVTQAGVAPIQWAQFLGTAPAPFFQHIFQHFVQPARRELAATATSAGTLVTDQAQNFRQQLAALPAAARQAALVQHLRVLIQQVLGFRASEQIDSRQRLFDLGLDSLMAVELRNRIGTSLHCSVPALLVFKYPTLDAMAAYLLQDVLALADARVSTAVESSNAATALFSKDRETMPPPANNTPDIAVEAAAHIANVSLDDAARRLSELLEME